MVLEEVQMPLGELLEIMRLAKVAAIRAGKLRTTLRLQQDIGLFVRVETLFHQPPWWRNPEAKSQYIQSIHCLSLRWRK